MSRFKKGYIEDVMDNLAKGNFEAVDFDEADQYWKEQEVIWERNAKDREQRAREREQRAREREERAKKREKLLREIEEEERAYQERKAERERVEHETRKREEKIKAFMSAMASGKKYYPPRDDEDVIDVEFVDITNRPASNTAKPKSKSNYITATAIGRRMNEMGKGKFSAQKINKILLKIGYIEKEGKSWILTSKASFGLQTGSKSNRRVVWTDEKIFEIVAKAIDDGFINLR